MRQAIRGERRQGMVLPMVALAMVGLVGLLALAIDIGMVAISRSQCQNAADAAAMAGARTMNGDSSGTYNFSAVPGQAIKAAIANKVLSTQISGDASGYTTVNSYTFSSGQVTIAAGAYTYVYDDSNSANEGFKIQFPKTDATEPYSAVRATVTNQANSMFSRIFGISTFNTSASATAVHRPRDVVIVVDLSGSMRFQSLPGIPYYGSRTTSMNPDPYYPQFGHYADTAGAALYGNTQIATGGEIAYYDPANISVSTDSGPPILEYFFQNAVGVTPGTGNRAFSRSPNTYNTAPGGDNFLKKSLNTDATNYAHTIKEFNNNSTTTNPKFEYLGYAAYATSSSFSGYTEGPGYWGKTFWVWPPCPAGQGVVAPPSSLTDTAFNWYDNGSRDWRQRFFVGVNTSSSNAPFWIHDNRVLFDSSGRLKTPGTTTTGITVASVTNRTCTYRINYAAILYWLAQSPVHFPSTIQAGRIRYYTALPDGTDNTLNNRWWTTAGNSLADLNERFWKGYIDFVLGLDETGVNSYASISDQIGNGDYFTWSGSTISVNAPPSPQPSIPGKPYTTGVTAPYQTTTTGAYQTTTTSAKANSGSASVSVNSLGTAPTANTNYVTFNNDLTRVYKITNSSKTALNVSPALTATVNSGSSVQVYATNNAVGVSAVSLNTLTTAPTANTEYVGFGGSTANLYQITNSNTKQVNLGTTLAAAVALQGASAEVYVSNGAAGTNTLGVSGLSQNPTPNQDYVIINNDTANPYLITAVTTKGSATVLTLSPSLASAVNVNGATVQVYSPYLNYADDVRRPKHQFWFGPQTWVDWLGNYNTGNFSWPGNVPEAQSWSCKVGIQTAIDDIKKNHPSDFVALAFFSHPTGKTSGGSWYDGYHNRSIVPLGRNYQQLKDALWFPPTTVTAGVSEITPYDADFYNTPRAVGGTTPEMGFMLAYNILSNSTSNLRLYTTPTNTYRGNAGGLGRKGASRLIIFETDGAPNRRAAASFTSAGADSYYKIRLKNPTNVKDPQNEVPTVSTTNDYTAASNAAYAVIQQICKSESQGGFSTTRKPVQIYSIGYGSLFEPSNSGSNQNLAKTFLQNVQSYGGGSTLSDWQLVYGTSSERINRIRTAFQTIMQNGVQVSLIE